MSVEARCENPFCKWSSVEEDEWLADQDADEHHAQTGHQINLVEL